MAAAALKIGSQFIKHAPKLKKLKPLTKLDKILRTVKSTKNVVQNNLKTNKSLSAISETIGNVRNGTTQRIANLRMQGSSKYNAFRLDSHDILKNRTTYLRNKSLNKALHNYMGGMGPKDMIRNLSKAKGVGGKLFAGARFIGPAYELWELKEGVGKMLQRNYKEPIESGNPDNSIFNSIRNLATNAKYFNNREKFLRTKMAGEADLKYNIPFTGSKWNPFDDTPALRPNAAKMHNMRVDSLSKWDKREEDKKKEEE